MIVVGSRLEAFSTNNWAFHPKSSKQIRIDLDPEALSLNWRANVNLVADAALALNDIEAALLSEGYEQQAERCEKIETAHKDAIAAAQVDARNTSIPKSVVFPAPRNPVSKVTGKRVSVREASEVISKSTHGHIPIKCYDITILCKKSKSSQVWQQYADAEDCDQPPGDADDER